MPGEPGYVAFTAKQGRFILLLAACLAVAGALAAFQLPVGLFPQVAFPRVVVDLDGGARPAEQTALLLTRPVEQAIRTVPGVLNVRSETTRGSAQIGIDFGWGRDMTASTLLVEAAIAQALPSLPAGAAYTVRRMDPTVFPIIAYALQAEPRTPLSPAAPSPEALRDLAEFQIVPLLASIPGLARVGVQGGETREVQVLADPRRLALYGLAMNDVAAALAASSTLQAVGRLQDRGKLFLVVASHQLGGDQGPEQVRAVGDIVIRAEPAGLVRIRDVAELRDGVVPHDDRVLEDGRPAVLFNVYEQPDGNAVRVSAEVKARLAGFALPRGVRLVSWYDQSELVTRSAASVRDAVAIGLVLAGAVLAVFLRSLRATAVALVVVPAALAGTVLALWLLGLTFNIMTLGGIAAAVGLLIDDAIVMIEHVARRAGRSDPRQGEPGPAPDRVLPAAREFLAPLTGSSLATLIVFLPLSLQSGVTGAFSKALAATMAAALLISYALTALAVPVLAHRFIDFGRWRDPGAAGPGRFGRLHARALGTMLRRPSLLAVAAIPLLALGWFAFGAVQTGFMPAVDEGGFVMDYYARPGTSPIEAERQMAQVDAILAAQPEIATVSRRLGSGLGGDLGQSHHGDMFARLRRGHPRSTQAVMADVQAQVEARVPGVATEASQLMEDLVGDLTAVPQPIEIKLYGADPTVLIAAAGRLAGLVSAIPGVAEVKSGVQIAGDALDVRIDPIRAAVEGATPDEVAQAVSAALSGILATRLPSPTRAIGVRVRLPDALTLSQAGLAELPVRAADGHVFALRRVADIVRASGEPQLSRENLQPMVAVTGRIEGGGIQAAIGAIREILARPAALPPGVRSELGGLYREQQTAFAGLARAFAAALAAEFALLVFLYQKFWLAASVILCALLSTIAVFAALWISGVALGVTALMGMTMTIGIGAEMSIFLVSEYVELASRLPRREAIAAASANRLRPITMTTLAAILTLLPLAFAIGEGSAIQQPLAIAIIAGLLLEYPLVLLVLPVLMLLAPGRKASPE